jgi:serine protease AprX
MRAAWIVRGRRAARFSTMLEHIMFATSSRAARLGLVLLVSFCVAACGRGFGDGASGKGLPAAVVKVGNSLQQRMAGMGPDDTAEVIVTYRQKTPLSAAQVQALRDQGFKGIYFKYLPIAGVVAKRAQIESLLARPDEILSLWHNDELQYDNEEARYMTSVDQAQAAPELRNANGEPITGKGVTILVNDSGIDGLHPDLINKVAVNTFGHTDLRGVQEDDMYPSTPTECPGPCNTDVLGSHGTHVAGIAAGDGTASGGRFAGAARGATLAGIGSGATLLVLNTLGGFDYALTLLNERPELNLRIVTNSFGSTGDQGTEFDPADPTNVATKMLADAGIIVVFSAGNSGSGPGSITGNYKKAPWILIAGNGTKSGLLAPSSSRGALTDAVYEVEVDGELLTVEDYPTVVTPGTDIISARAVAADPFLPLDLSSDLVDPNLSPAERPFYTYKTGTSMAAPHLAGLVALLLEANPALTWREVKQIFRATATNMPGYSVWEVGAGYANVEAAIAMALDLRKDYGSVNHSLRSFNAVVPLKNEFDESRHTLDYLPADNSETVQFEVGEDIGLVVAVWERPMTSTCACAVALIDPTGKQYRSSVGLPVLAPRVSAVGPGKAGTWTLTVRGLTSLSGVPVDPSNTNGISTPGSIDVRLQLYPRDASRGLEDVAGHPEIKQIERAVFERLVDGTASGFAPDAVLTRAEFAEYLMAWGIRQTRAHAPLDKFSDVQTAGAAVSAAADALTRPGALILSRSPQSLPVIRVEGAAFNPAAVVTREEMAYALVQALGRQTQAEAHGDAALTAPDGSGGSVPVEDGADVNPIYRGHVQEALNLGILRADFSSGSARVLPAGEVTRLDYTRSALATFDVTPFP